MAGDFYIDKQIEYPFIYFRWFAWKVSSRGDSRGSLDPQVLARLLRTLGTPEEFNAMLREFVDGSGTLLADLQRALTAGRILELERTAHTLKSMAHLVGARSLEESCRHVERAARARQPVAREEIAGLSACVEEAQGAVARFLR